MKGYIHSIQSLGAVDGPGVRSVVFLQGCALRCAYCHNPDTWELPWEKKLIQEKSIQKKLIQENSFWEAETTEQDAEQLAAKLLRFRPYWGAEGGVTVSGGEPLIQADFVAELFYLLHQQGVHTVLDTAGQITGPKAEAVLRHTDLALVDLKFLTEEEYRLHARGSRQRVEEFLTLTNRLKVPIWIRHVVVPGLTATAHYLKQIKQQAEQYSNLQKIEWLPFHNLCQEKYEKMGIRFPLAETPAMGSEELERLLRQ